MKKIESQPFPASLDYSLLFRQLPDRALLIGIDDPEFTVLDMTDAHAAMTGQGREKVIGKPLFSSFPDMSEKYKTTGVSDLLESFREAIRTKQPNTQRIFRYDIRDSKGKGFTERYWRNSNYPIFDANKALRYLLQIPVDATAEIKAERRIEQIQNNLEEALEIGKVGSWVWDLDENLILADKNLAKMFDLASKEASEGLPLRSFLSGIHAADRVRIRKAIDNVQTKNAPFNEEYRTHMKDGNIRWVMARGKVKLQPDNKRIFTGVIVDVTERRDLQLQIELAKHQDELNRQEASILLRRNEELEALSRTKDEFVALASHQLRTPATAVKQYIGMVLQGYVGDVTDLQTDMLTKAFEGNERQIEIINQILNAARVDTGRLIMTLVPIDLRSLAQGIADEMRPAIELKQHTFTLTLPKRTLPIQADLAYLRMAIENLLHNASVYTPEGGRIEMALRRVGSEAVLSISDNGVGIKKADLSKLFVKFARIHNPLSVQAGGSGIGLYLAAEIARLHGGKVAVTSKPRRGSTFAISLPLAQNKN